MKITIADLVTTNTDADLDSLTFVSTNSPTTNGSSLVIFGGLIFVPANTVADSFTYTFRDDFGGTNTTGTVNIAIANNIVSSQTNASVTLTPSNITVTFFGIPNTNYFVQRDTNTDFTSLGYTNISKAAGTNGEIKVEDYFSDLPGGTDNTNGSAFYRLVSP